MVKRGEHSKSCHVTMFWTQYGFRLPCILEQTIRPATIFNHVLVNLQGSSSSSSSWRPLQTYHCHEPGSCDIRRNRNHTKHIHIQNITHSQSMYNILMLRYVADPQRMTAECRSYAPSRFLTPSYKTRAWCGITQTASASDSCTVALHQFCYRRLI